MRLEETGRKSVVISEFMMDQVTKSSCVKVREKVRKRDKERHSKRRNQKHGEKDKEEGDRPQNPKWLAM